MEEILQKMGLNSNEVKMYLALLELGPSKVSEITKKAGITRTLGYTILEKLNWHGLVSQTSGKGSTNKYFANHPRSLVNYAKSNKKQWENNVVEMEKKLDDFLSIFKIAKKPVIRYQDGDKGLKNIYMESLESKTEILSIAEMEGWDTPEFKKWGQEYNRERSKRKIKERMLLLDTKQARKWMKNYKGNLKYTEYRWIKQEQLPGIEDLGGEINIFEDKVLMALNKKPNRMGVVIQSEPLTKLLKTLFELAWQVGKPVQ